MFDNAHITSITACGSVTTANPYRNGTGTLEELYEAPAPGCVIQTIIVKAVASTDNGMVRLFIYDPTTDATYLVEEFFIATAEASGKFETYSSTLIFPNAGLFLKEGCKLLASTEYEAVFNIVASGFTWSYA